jgi:hypothetical protein
VFANQKGLLIVATILSFILLTSSTTTTFYTKSNSVFASTDSIRPSITILKPSESHSFSSGLIEVEGTARDDIYGSGVKSVEVRVDNGEYTTAKSIGGMWSYWSITLDTQSSGSKRIVARVTDNAGNQNWDEITVTISGNTDRNPLSIEISQPTDNALIPEDKVVVAGRTSDEMSGVRKVQVRVNNGPYVDASPASPGDWSSWSITLDFTSQAAADYKIFARVSDNAGNQDWDDVDITRPFYDDFSGGRYRLAPGDISPNDKWHGVWDGGGAFGVKRDQEDSSNNIFYEETAAVTAKSQTESALVLTTQEFEDFKLSVDVRTDKQTRQNSAPNPWEVGWVIWKWNDNTNFYYFLLRTDGAEAGKYDGGVNPVDQRILKTSSSFKASIGEWMHWDIIAKGNHITVIVDGTTVFDFDDTSSFDSGTIGLYSEDAEVSFDNVAIVPL